MEGLSTASTATPAQAKAWQLEDWRTLMWRAGLMGLVVVIELFLVRVATVGKYTHWYLTRDDYLGVIAGLAPMLRGLAMWVLMFILITGRLVWQSSDRSALLTYRPSVKTLAVNLLLFAAVIAVLWPLPTRFEPTVTDLTSWQAVLLVSAPIFTAALLFTFPGLFFAPRVVLQTMREHWPLALLSLLVALWYTRSQEIDVIASWLIGPTLVLVEQFFAICGLPEYRVWGEEGHIFGNETFRAAIAPDCSGYEGATLTLAILAAYMVISRNHLRQPMALIVLPIAAAVMFLLNSVRIGILVLIGVHWSPEIAVGGFHTVAGWMNLIVTVIVSVWVLERFFARREVAAAGGSVGKPVSNTAVDPAFDPVVETGPSVLNRFWLIPLAVWIASGLLTTLFTGEFRWLYPLQVLATGAVIAVYWGRLNLPVQGPSVLSIGVGLAVAVMWLAIIPVDAAVNAEFEQALFSANIGLAAAWILFRIVGTAVLVPYAEELAFRGFFQNWLAAWFKNPWFALAVTSVAFGFVHSNVLAGALAGLAYGLVRMHRGSLWDAIAAHAVTNLLLALYVLATGGWSYW